MKKFADQILYFKSSDLRQYHINNKYYLFDNKDMRIMEVSEPDNEILDKKYVSRKDIDLTITKRQKRANYAGYNAIIELTNACNLRCVYCFRQEDLKNSHLDKQTCIQIINHIKAIDIEKKVEGDTIRVIFFGGEPLINFNNLKFIVDELKENINNYLLEYSISTNGALLTKEKIKFLIDNDFNSQISFEGDKEIQDKSRPFTKGKGSYDFINDKIKNIPNEHKNKFSLAFSVSRITKNIDEIIDKYISYGFTTFNLLFIIDDVIGVNQLTYNDIGYIKTVIKKILILYKKSIVSNKYIVIHPLFEIMTNLYTRIPKGVCNSTINIEAFGQDGAIYPCQRFLSNPEFEYGNVKKGYDIEKLDKIRSEECFFDSDCAKCWMKHFCSGKCAYLQTIPNSTEKNKLGCIIQSIMWDSVIEFFIEINIESENALDEFFRKKANIY